MTTDFILAPGEEFLQCPYEPSHIITNARILTHLDKCRRAYLNGMSASAQKRVMKICRHNATHHIPDREIRFHEERCHDAFSVIKHLAYHNSEEGNRDYEREKRLRQEKELAKFEPKYSSPPKKGSGRAETKPDVSNEWNLEEEDWEAEDTGYKPGYDPQEKLKKELVLYVPAGLTKSERKKFRLEVREKTAASSLTGENLELPTAIRYEHKPDLTQLHIDDSVRDEAPQEYEQKEAINAEDSRRDNRDNEAGSSSRNRDRDRNPRSSENDCDRNYPRSSDRDRDRNYSRSSDKDRDRNYSRSSDKDRDRNYSRSSDKDRDRNYSRSSDKDRDRNYSRSSDKDRDRNYPRSSDRDRDRNYPRSSDKDRDGYQSRSSGCNDNERSHSPDRDTYYARHPGNDNFRSEASRNQPSSSRGSHYDRPQETEDIGHSYTRRERVDYIDDDFVGHDPFAKDFQL